MCSEAEEQWYQQVMDKRKANGDMWSSTPLVSNDLEACQEIAAALAE